MQGVTKLNRLDGRRIIVLGKRNRVLNAAITAGAKYNNPSGIVEIVEAERDDREEWVWESVFDEAARRPNTFIAMEDGSVLRKRLLDIRDRLEAISESGGGLIIAHHSNELFLRILDGQYFVLADDSLKRLIELLDAQSEIRSMGLDVVSQDTQQAEAQRLVQNLRANGIPTTEISDRLGLNRSTIYRWREKLGMV